MKALYDVAISGGGPAGSYCAYRCAQAGLSTVLLERQLPPWTKTCAGGVLMRAASRLDFPIPDSIVEKQVVGFQVVGEDFRERFRFDRCLTYTVDRTGFDLHLLRMAEKAGAEIRCGQGVESVRESDKVELSTSQETVIAKCAVIAEGAGSRNARRLLGPPPRGGMAIGLRSVDVTEEDPGDEIEVFFLDTPTKRLERYPMFPLMGWMFPYRGRANFGVGGHGYGRAELMSGMDRVWDQSLARAVERGKPSAHPIPVLPRDRLSTSRTMLVGDAAGLVSPMSGEGLSHGLASAILASDAARSFVNGHEGALRDYERRVKGTVVRDIKAATVISPVLHWLLGVVDTRAFFHTVRQEGPYVEAWTRMALGEESWQRLLMMTVPRFHRLFFRSLT
ncbi:MAG TPA: NAD(P)/FAD-dependent oxidoreductase [Methanomassiliicoccales archaeon]|nr:NAD(P)/FAD-dependent oxidoreductase [Methanomassiliicoccales archaeon]